MAYRHADKVSVEVVRSEGMIESPSSMANLELPNQPRSARNGMHLLSVFWRLAGVPAYAEDSLWV